MLLTNLLASAEIVDLSAEVIEKNSLIPESGELQASFAELLRQPTGAETGASGSPDAMAQPILLTATDEPLPPGGNALPLLSDMETDAESGTDLALVPATDLASDADAGLSVSPAWRAVLPDDAADVIDASGNAINTETDIGDIRPAVTPVVPQPATTDRALADLGSRAASMAAVAEAREATRQTLPPTAASTALQATGETDLQDIRSRNPVETELPRQAQAPRGGAEAGLALTQRTPPGENPALNGVAQDIDFAVDKPDAGSRQNGDSLMHAASTSFVDSAASRETLQTAQRATPLQTTVPLAVGDDGWGEAFGERVTWLSRGGIQSAELKLHPAELGPIRVTVSVKDDAASLTFTASNAVTREAIEQALPRLREMLSENGLTLTGTDINDTSPGEDRETGREIAAGLNEASGSEEGDTTDSAEQLRRSKRPLGLVDTFA